MCTIKKYLRCYVGTLHIGLDVLNESNGKSIPITIKDVLGTKQVKAFDDRDL
jgi:hypothetical protein